MKPRHIGLAITFVLGLMLGFGIGKSIKVALKKQHITARQTAQEKNMTSSIPSALEKMTK